MQKIIFILSLYLAASCSRGDLKYQRQSRKYSLDETTPPCADYHAYICGPLEKSFKLPPDRARYTFAFSDSREALLSYKKNYFQVLRNRKPRTQIEERLKNAYLACMDEAARKSDEERHIQRIRHELSRIENRSQLLDYFAEKVFSGDAAFLALRSKSNFDDPLFADAFLLPTPMSLPVPENYEDEDIEMDLIDLFQTFFKELDLKDPGVKARRLFSFEKRLARSYPTPVEFREVMSRKSPAKRSELKKLRNLRTSKILQRVPKKTNFDKIARAALVQLNADLGRLPVEDLKDFYLYHAVSEFIEDSHPTFGTRSFEFARKYLGGPAVRPARDESCTSYLMKTYPMGLDSTLLPEIFPKLPKERFLDLAETIRSSLIESIEENTWLSETGKVGAIKKIKTATLMLISPETETQWNFRPETDVHPERMIENQITLRRAIKNQELTEFGVALPKDRWRKGPLDVNAYYVRSLNQLVLLAGILQPPFYDEAQTRVQNLAGIGTVIGHELGHGIDDKGRLYDERGRLRNWMTEGDRKNLEARSLPLVQEFEAVAHNGRLTLGENTGDNVGLSTSFRAAFPMYQEGKYSRDTLREFFVHYGRTFCEVQTGSSKRLHLRTNPHSLGKERINRQVRQQAGFAEAYACKEGDPMYLPKHKRIRIW